MAACTVAAQAQATLVAVPASVQVNANPNNPDTEAHVDLINLSNAEITVKWERTVVSITPGCQTQVCDPILCYLPTVSSKTFPLAANDTAMMIVHFLNFSGEPASALVHLKFTNLSNPADTVTAVYTFTGVSSSKDLTPVPAVKVFPNPAADYFQIAEVDQAAAYIRLYDRNGRQVSFLNAAPNQRYNIADLPAGMYILSVEEENGKILQAGEIYKR